MLRSTAAFLIGAGLLVVLVLLAVCVFCFVLHAAGTALVCRIPMPLCWALVVTRHEAKSDHD